MVPRNSQKSLKKKAYVRTYPPFVRLVPGTFFLFLFQMLYSTRHMYQVYNRSNARKRSLDAPEEDRVSYAV